MGFRRSITRGCVSCNWLFYKEQIRMLIVTRENKYDMFALGITVLLTGFCVFNYWDGRCLYYFDMKPLYYKELCLAIIIPSAFGIVLCRITYWITHCQALGWLNKGLEYWGRMTIPIMFLHIPLNYWKDILGYGRGVYVLIGVGGPVLFTLLLNRFKIMRKLFGLPKLPFLIAQSISVK